MFAHKCLFMFEIRGCGSHGCIKLQENNFYPEKDSLSLCYDETFAVLIFVIKLEFQIRKLK